VIYALLFSSCAGVKKFFCSLNFNQAESDLRAEVTYVDGIYWHYVNLLKSGQEEVSGIVIAMDLFLATAKPILAGIQKGICYPQGQIDQSLNFANEVKERVETQTEIKIL